MIRKSLRFLLLLALFVAPLNVAWADDLFKPIASTGGTATTAASSATTIPSLSGVPLGSKLRIANGGVDPIRVAFGTSSSTSVADTDLLITPGTTEIISRGTWTYFSIKSLTTSVPYSLTTGEGQ